MSSHAGRFVLVLTDSEHKMNGCYVSKPGVEHSYCSGLNWAQRFPTRAAAKASACGNERVEKLRLA